MVTKVRRLFTVRRLLRAHALVGVVGLALVACSSGDEGGDGSTAAPPSGVSGTGGGRGGQGGASNGSGGAVSGSAGQAAGTAGAAGKATGGAAGGGGAQAGHAGSGGEKAGAAGMAGGQGGAGGGSGLDLTCETGNDCAPLVPQTKPASCATAVCDPASKKCRFKAKDFDGDGHGTTSCKSLDGSITVELGDDCDDTNERAYPGAWDGPEGDGHASACDDGLDNDCDGKADDDALLDGTGCKCVVGDKRACAETSGGKPIVYPTGTPVGECRYGAQTCLEQAGKTVWGPCTDAVGPALEECNGKDDDCDGENDEIDDVTNPATYYCDNDGDDHVTKGAASVKACAPGPSAPCAGKWIAKPITFDDCNDEGPTEYPGAPEFCDLLDNDCDGQTDEDKQTTYYCDGDGDGVLMANPTGFLACQLPADGCPAPGKWVTQVVSGIDCDDTNKDKFPGNKEQCDGIDNDCNGMTDEGVEPITWYFDGDGDGFFSKSATKTLAQCTNPGKEAPNCPDGQATCEGRWRDFFEQEDCDDSDAAFYPGAWDGPESLTVGIKDGWLLEFFQRDESSYDTPPGSGEAPAATLPPATDPQGKRLAQLKIDWGQGRPAPSVGSDHFVVRATGTLVVEAPLVDGVAPTYTFDDASDDGIRVWIDDTPCIDAWVLATAGTRSCAVALAPGEHPIRVEYFERTGVASIALSWSGPGINKQTLRVVSKEGRSGLCDGLKQDCSAGAADLGIDDTGLGRFLCGQDVNVGSCSPGRIAPCQESPSAGIGVCRNGWKLCSEQGAWGSCNDEILPAPSGDTCGNSLDDDCDGAVDEDGATTYYCDNDGDGDTPSNPTTLTTCTLPANKGCGTDISGQMRCCHGLGGGANDGLWTTGANGADCKDDNPAVNKDATEVCDGVDNDCNGATDDVAGLNGECNVDNKNAGACLNGGNLKCSGGGVAGANGLRCVPKSAGIGGTSFHTTPAWNGSWDWDCSGLDDLEGCTNNSPPPITCTNTTCCTYSRVCATSCGGTTTYCDFTYEEHLIGGGKTCEVNDDVNGNPICQHTKRGCR